MIDLRLVDEWLDDATLRVWLSASDCSIFNYRDIFTSGAAALARSYGLPLLIPRRLASADLDEPHPHVFRIRYARNRLPSSTGPRSSDAA